MIKVILMIVFALALAIFASQNTGLVTVKFLGWQSQAVSLALLVVLVAVAGAIIALIATLPMHIGHRREIARSRREIEELRQQGTDRA